MNQRHMRQNDGPVKLIGQPAMPTPNHHGTYDNLAKGRKLPAQRSVDVWAAQTQANVATEVTVSACATNMGAAFSYYAETASKKMAKMANACKS
jgi:hypothetical protein